MMTNLEHDLIVALRKTVWVLENETAPWAKQATVNQARRLLERHDPEYTCPVCDGRESPRSPVCTGYPAK